MPNSVPATQDASVSDLDAVVDALGGVQRPGQHQMVQAVAGAFQRAEHLLVQAGTGTGKSLGYVVPALRHSVTAQERVVISTATLALQNQLLSRDIPTAVNALSPRLPREPEVALLKGWQHYICLNKVHGGYPTEDQPTLFGAPEQDSASSASGLGQQVLRARAWAQETQTGDRDDLVPGVSDRAWRQVSVTARECIGSRCPMLNECFAEQAKRRAHEADVVVTNHAFVGLSVTGAPHVLPEYQAIVLDEAHDLVDRVTSAATASLSVSMVDQVAREARRGMALNPEDLDTAKQGLAVALAKLPDGTLPAELPNELMLALKSLGQSSRLLLSKLGKPTEEQLTAHRSVSAKLTDLFDLCDRLLALTASDVAWCAREFGGGEPTIYVAPLDVSQALRHNLLEEHTAVFTSATLSIGGAFEPAARAVGLHVKEQGETWRCLDVGSPFDYPNRAILYLPADLPTPGRDPVTEAQAELIAELLSASRGGALGLFSSRRAAQVAVELVRELTDLPILAQGDDQLGTLVSQFAADPYASLFGTMSLWQGVDVAGETNRLVIIDRIPFPRPDDPISSARARDVESRGGSGFALISLQYAAVRLAQGAGRLIRSDADRGVLAVLDPRIATRGYGRVLINTLPPMWRTSDRAVVMGALERLAP